MEEQNKVGKKNNHVYPWFHIKKWEAMSGMIYNKANDVSKKITDKFCASKYYYSLGEEDEELENRLEKFECRIAHLIKKIDEAKDAVLLTGKEIEQIKLYGFLCACRQHNTREVVKSDESGIYKSNNYLFGVPRVFTQQEAVNLTNRILDEYDKILGSPKKQVIKNWNGVFDDSIPSIFTNGLHLCIFRSETNNLCVSNICTIIENTMDGDYLYSFTPVSPKTAILLVKSKYYNDEIAFENTKHRFGQKYGNGEADPFLSVLLGNWLEFELEKELFCSYYSIDSKAHVKPTKIIQKEYSSAFVKISVIPQIVLRQFNSIFYEDGDEFLYLDKEELDFVKTHPLACREITVEF